MYKLYLTLLVIWPLYLNANFIISNDATWNYHLDSYTDVGGILESDKATPVYEISRSVLDTMINSLPERQKADIEHPEYFPSPEPEIVVRDTAEVFVTFYHEGAGYKNSLGYYTYDGDTNRTRPNTRQEIMNDGKLLFPNASLINSGGDLLLGTTVSLGELTVGTKVIFFVVSNGWKGSSTGVRVSSDWMFSSWSPLNLEYDEQSRRDVPYSKHTALLWKNVGPGNILLMAFEDILRTNRNCDHDFNDLLFSISSSPMDALTDSQELETGVTGFALAPEERDTDNDGVNDAFDSYPEDAERVYDNYYPSSTGKATLVFEDMWPKEGDYDMNDLSIGFSIKEVKGANQKVKDIVFNGQVQSYGAGYKNGFALQLNTPLSNIESVQMSVNSGAKFDIMNRVIEDNNNTIVKIFDDASDYLGRFVNVYKNFNFIESSSFELTIVMRTPAKLDSPPYNPFLIVRKALKQPDGSYLVRDDIEVHLPNYMPTSKAPQELFGTYDDTSNLDENRTYQTWDDKPWALLIPTYFAHPAERVNIKNAYHNYGDWVKNKGKTNEDWYIHNRKNGSNQSYADESKIIIRP